MGTPSANKSLAPVIAGAAILLEQVFCFFANEHSRFKLILALNAVALLVTLFLMALFRQLGDGFLRRLPIFYGSVLGAMVLLSLATSHGRDYLLIDNPNGFSVEVQLDGRSLGSFAPNTYAEVAALSGPHHLLATDSSGKKLEDAEFKLRRAGLIAHIRAIYVIGGAARYAAITFDYRNQSHPRVVPLPAEPDTHLVLLHQSFDTEEPALDRSFAHSISVGRSDSTSRTHLCHYWKGTNGCDDEALKATKIQP